MNSCFVQEGVIVGKDTDSVTVAVTPEKACASCKAHGVCSESSGQKQKIHIKAAGNEFSCGETVKVKLMQADGMKAVRLAYLYPLLLVIFTLTTIYIFTEKDWLSGLVSISVLIPYFVIVHRYRSNIDKEFRFTIEKLH